MKHVTTRLRGRLGNNMFQVGALYTYAKMHGYTATMHNYSGDYPIVFRNVDTDADPPVTSNYKSLEHNHFGYSELPLDASGESINIHGVYCHFQHEKYLDRELLSELFAIPEALKESLTEKYLDIDSRCSIHIRRGDYVSRRRGRKRIWPTHGFEYVNKARTHVDSSIFLVSSDDISWCKRNLPKDMDVLYVDESPEASMYAMSLCEHNIISNSSFSWWSAYLNTNKNKKVITPKQWFFKDNPVVLSGQADIFSDIPCEGWIRV